ncbi:uncharacterized protein LOC112591329 isoform X2 [Melanaphis sacchari]|nr:uncharacterized protein LOC112591329 isoform X2 [Melanaphis sacchari]XP_025190910.1 uncharacterized protein LOC112591329 isoform X2 [Melanaphis sacchari]XP_025190915.1 uncharacterized protein LOC112591329 isoform X2 [Melanaphis sacchari]XP_025190922.1 uncharacterized protein LOC112591329 isoform X2 [Melanaphis sacchari]XP_025190931.1 uncharacterized protein LOC112591329 isoform X2 [Melanaphis sacchari]XP_025190939.1 uncharacterized protein LOC112591329 isoform X2 [Melanaphis sacchari]
MFDRSKSTVDLKRYSYNSEPYLIIATVLYTTSLTVSTSLENEAYRRKFCQPLIPFGECLVGIYESQLLVYSDTKILQYLISFVVLLLAGAWSDRHGRRRKPLIFLPIIVQILTDGLIILSYYWSWPLTFDDIIVWTFPALYVGRNMFWVGVMSYVSENSTIKSRTLKHGIIIATYPLSLLIGNGVVVLIGMFIQFKYYYGLLFLVSLLLNLIALMVVKLYIKDTSDSYDKDIIWQKPKYVLKEFTSLFENKLINLTVVLMICQSILVTRIGCDYDLLMIYIKHSNYWYNDEEVYFTVLKMLAIFFGIVFSSSVLSHCMKINDLKICILFCCFYIAAAISYIFPNQIWQIIMIAIIYLCHGTVVTIISSIVSKLVAIDQLGRLNSIQMCMNSLLTLGVVYAYQIAFGYINYTKIGHLCLITFLYVLLTLPILYVFVILYSKYKDFWQNYTVAEKQKNVYVISQ